MLENQKEIKIIVNNHLNDYVSINQYPLADSPLNDDIEDRQLSIDYNGYSYRLILNELRPRLEVRKINGQISENPITAVSLLSEV